MIEGRQDQVQCPFLPPRGDQPLELPRPRPRPERPQQRDRQMRQPPAKRPQPRDSPRIRPLQVLDHNRDRPSQRSLLDPLDERIDHPELQSRYCDRPSRHVGCRPQRVAEDTERPGAIQLIGVCAKQLERQPRGGGADGVDQPRLADPRLPLE